MRATPDRNSLTLGVLGITSLPPLPVCPCNTTIPSNKPYSNGDAHNHGRPHVNPKTRHLELADNDRSGSALNDPPRVVAENAEHLSCCIGSIRIGVGSIAAAARPRMSCTVHHP